MSDFAHSFLERLPTALAEKAYVVGLSGDLGAGKTTFVQQVARQMGVKESVTSPTFVIAQSYQTSHPIFSRLVHIDAYRLKEESRDTFGFEEYAKDSRTLILVEWPENLPKDITLPKEVPTLSFKVVGEDSREISYTPL